MPLKLGRLPRKFNRKTLLLHDYLQPDFVTPAKVYWEYKIPDDAWQMFGNDTIGDCTCACIAHMLMLVTAHTGKIVVPELKDVIGAYSAVSGYDPATGANDNGAAITDVLNYWQTTGLAGHKILGWAEIDSQNRDNVNAAIWAFGGVDTGFNVPQSAIDQFNSKFSWSVVPNSPIEGGHSVPVFGEGALGDTCVTWGARQQLLKSFWQTYFDEAYAVYTQDWVNNATGLAPNMFDMDKLKAALAAVRA